MNTFLKTPFIPEKKVSHVLLDGRASEELVLNLKMMGITPLFTPTLTTLYKAVSYHPDMLIHPIGENIFIAAPGVYEIFFTMFKPLGIKLIKGKSRLKSNYPENIAYNVARIDEIAFHNTHFTDKKIREYFERNNIQIIHVKQGYTKCSTSIISKQAIITSDKGIAKAVDNYNIDVLYIEPGYISLPGLNYGFIGGATGLISSNTLAVAGELKHHPSYKKIEKFCNKHSKNIISLTQEKAMDIGSIIPICCFG